MKYIVIGAILLGMAGTALAHDGVQNKAVMARMMAMGAIGEATKVLGQMAKGSVAFDAQGAQAAAAVIAGHAAQVPALFEAEEDDPLSEALPVIWANFEDFTEQAKALEEAALAAGAVATLDELRAAMGGLGGACQACHKEYRQ